MQWIQRGMVRSYYRVLGHFSLLMTVVVLGVLGFIYLFAGEIYDYRDTVDLTQLPEVDAIVCLAGGRGRISSAGDLWYRYWLLSQQKGSSVKKVPVLYLSGMGPQASWNVLSRQLHPEVLLVIQRSHIVIERESSNTDANARWLVRYAQTQGWKKVLLVTSSYHMKRARYIFNKVFRRSEAPLDLETLSTFQDPFNPKNWRSGPNGIRVTLLEYLKWIYYYSVWKPQF